MPSRSDGLAVRRTSAGLGLFALKPIKAGKRIIEYTGVVITNEEAERKGGKYLFEIDEKYTLDGSAQRPVRSGELRAALLRRTQRLLG